MSAKKLGVIAIVSTVCFSAICIATFRFRVQPRVEYTYHLGNDPTEVDLVFCLPTKDLQSVPETVIPGFHVRVQSFNVGQSPAAHVKFARRRSVPYVVLLIPLRSMGGDDVPVVLLPLSNCGFLT